jgi:hypothetical protein
MSVLLPGFCLAVYSWSYFYALESTYFSIATYVSIAGNVAFDDSWKELQPLGTLGGPRLVSSLSVPL